MTSRTQRLVDRAWRTLDVAAQIPLGLLLSIPVIGYFYYGIAIDKAAGLTLSLLPFVIPAALYARRPDFIFEWGCLTIISIGLGLLLSIAVQATRRRAGTGGAIHPSMDEFFWFVHGALAAAFVVIITTMVVCVVVSGWIAEIHRMESGGPFSPPLKRAPPSEEAPSP